MRTSLNQPSGHRKGLTLVELLVTVALMLLVMTIIVSTFQAATTSMTVAQTDQDLATITRRLDTVIRQDLQGATARFTPPLDPTSGLGYFEYGENAFADAQGEDTDDYIAFTAKAPPGQPFTGRIMLPVGRDNLGRPIQFRPTVVTSEYAEIIYYQRHGNLYRRVLLIAPERANSLYVDIDWTTGNYRYPGGGFLIDGVVVSWQGANDISVRAPAPGSLVPVPNTLGDLTNRENRAFRPRFTNDLYTPGAPPTVAPDGKAEDFNNDGIADWYPTLYPNVFNSGLVSEFPGRAVFDPSNLRSNPDALAFPYVFPGAFSVAGVDTGGAIVNLYTRPGGIHAGPYVNKGQAVGNWVLNHGPLDLGDNLPIPSSPVDRWTYWGFPTWLETRSPLWNMATKRFHDAPLGQGYGMTRLPNRVPEWLSPMNHWYSDGAGSSAFAGTVPVYLPADDLIASNVRSFDVKALDPNAVLYSSPANFGAGNSLNANTTPQYVDLGYAYQFKTTRFQTPDGDWTVGTEPGEEVTFGHEGRIPPFRADNRVDPQYPVQSWVVGLPKPPNNIGDDGMNVVRLRRVWDTWSTTYTRAPATPTNPFQGAPFARPTYPSYPPPYPSPLYGIRIQIRLYEQPESGGVTRTKSLTITQDFTDKL